MSVLLRNYSCASFFTCLLLFNLFLVHLVSVFLVQLGG
jgi:hypothetical protein